MTEEGIELTGEDKDILLVKLEGEEIYIPVYDVLDLLQLKDEEVRKIICM